MHRTWNCFQQYFLLQFPFCFLRQGSPSVSCAVHKGIISSFFNPTIIPLTKKQIAAILTWCLTNIFWQANSIVFMQLFYRLIILMPEKKAWLCVFNLPYKRNMARRWHVAAHNRQNEHQEHGRMAHIMLRNMKANGGSFVFIFTFATLAKSHTKITQIVRAGFAVN